MSRVLDAPAPTPARTRRAAPAVAVVVALVGGVVLVALASLALGARDIAPGVVVAALTGSLPADDYDAIVVLSERLPRTLLGLLVGACLGAAGAIMQAVTRNPLVDGGILGVELGAACAVVLGMLLLGVTDLATTFWFALLGAGVTAAAVWTVSRLTTGTSPAIALVICGAAASALLAAVVNLLIVRDEATNAFYRFWIVGQLDGRGAALVELWPFAVAGLVAALLLGGPLNALALGEAGAAGLGVDVRRTLLVCAAVAVVLCAAATAAVGPIGFVGLVGAHAARLLLGADLRRVVPAAAACGALLLLAADVAGRTVPGNGEIQVGIMTALVGAPVFVLLARSRRLVAA